MKIIQLMIFYLTDVRIYDLNHVSETSAVTVLMNPQWS